MKQLLVISTVVAWSITAVVSIWAWSEKSDTSINNFASEYAFHVVEQGLAGKDDPTSQMEQVKKWKAKGWTAQTGAIKTLCNIDKDRMTIVMKENVVDEICRIIRTAEKIEVLTPLDN